MSQNAQSYPVADIEKAEELSSTHSSCSSGRHSSALQVRSIVRGGDVDPHEVTFDESQLPTNVVFRTLSRFSTKSSWKDPGPPPDGGLAGWTQVVMGHLVIMNTWGFINSFGVFQTYYVTALDRTPADIAWVGSISTFLLFFIGTFTGRLTDAGFFREVFLFGTILQVLGIFMASLSTQYWQLFLAQGVCVGLGNGCLFTPEISLVSTYFSTKKSLALGIAACGSVTGGVIYPVIVQQLLPLVGFGWTMRCLGFVELACLIIVNIFAKQRMPPRRSGPIIEWAAFKEMRYSFFAMAMFFSFWGVYFAFFYLGSFARNTIDVPLGESINLLIILNAVGILGRVLPNYIADRYTGPINVMIPMVTASAVIVFCMIQVRDRVGLYVWAIAYGIPSASIQSLFPAVLGSLTSDLRKAGVRMGMIFTIVSFAVLTGPPIEGLLIQKGGGRYLYAQLFAGMTLTIGTVLMTAARIAKTGWTLKARA